LAVLCTYIETQSLDTNMEAEITAVYYRTSVDCSQKILHYVRIVVARIHPIIA